jgi:hypothetical protein
MKDRNLQSGFEGYMTPDVNEVSDQRWIAEDTEQQTPTHAHIRDEVRNSFSSNNSSDSAKSSQPLSPRTAYADPGTSSTRNTASVPPSMVDDGANQFSADMWNISLEERALMTNSAHFARDRRRRRGAIHLEVPLELPTPSLSSPTLTTPSPAPLLLPPYCETSRLSPDDANPEIASPATPATPIANKPPPRARLQRSFTPSERENAGVAIAPGLLRRLARPFSGPWRGPSSPLASVPMADAPPVGPLSRLRRWVLRRRGE